MLKFLSLLVVCLNLKNGQWARKWGKNETDDSHPLDISLFHCSEHSMKWFALKEIGRSFENEWKETNWWIFTINFDVVESFSDPLATQFNLIKFRNWNMNLKNILYWRQCDTGKWLAGAQHLKWGSFGGKEIFWKKFEKEKKMFKKRTRYSFSTVSIIYFLLKINQKYIFSLSFCIKVRKWTFAMVIQQNFIVPFHADTTPSFDSKYIQYVVITTPFHFCIIYPQNWMEKEEAKSSIPFNSIQFHSISFPSPFSFVLLFLSHSLFPGSDLHCTLLWTSPSSCGVVHGYDSLS